MLSVNVESIAPQANDPLREILNDLGPVGDETVVLGEDGVCVCVCVCVCDVM